MDAINVTLCYVTLRYVTLRYVMLCYVMGNFQPPEVRPIPDSPNLQVCLVFITCYFGKILKSTEEFYTHFTF
jgi:hypothetical protein